MPNPAVHAWFVENIPKKTEVPFQETQGMLTQQKGLPEMWCTVEYEKGSRQRLTVGRRALWREYGTAAVVFLIKSGKGPMPVLLVAQALADNMGEVYDEHLIEPSSGIEGTLRIENVSPPDGEPYEDGNWLVCTVSCAYTYDSVRGADGELTNP